MKTLLRFISALALLTQLRAADLTLSANVDTLLQAADYAAFRTSLGVAPLDSPVFTTRFDLEATGVRFTASNGSLTLLGLGDGADESIKLDFNTTANTLTVTSASGVTLIDMGAIGLTVGDISGGALTVTSFTVGGVAITASGAELNYTDGVTSAIQTQLNAKAALASPTFTGTVTIPTPFTLGAVSVLPTGTELNFVDGVTSAIQTQLDAKAALASPTFTGNPVAPTPAENDNDTSIATTAYVQTEIVGLGGGGIAFPRKYKTGKYYMTNPDPQADGSAVPVLNTVTYHPFPVGEALSIDRITVAVQTAGTATSTVRLGIYSDTDGAPDALLLDAGTVAGDSTGYKEITVNQALSAGTLYWVAVVWQTAAVGVLRGNSLGGGASWVGQDTKELEPRTCNYIQASVTGAFPANATPTSTGATKDIPNVKIRAQ